MTRASGPTGSCPPSGAAAQRHDPNEIRTPPGAAPARSAVPSAPSAPSPGVATGGVVMVLGGRRVPSGGQTRRDPISTSYAVVEPGVSPSTTIRA